MLPEEGAVVGPRHEAHLLRVGLRCHRQPQAFGVGPGLGLRLSAHGEQRPRQLALPEDVQDVGLVLPPVQAPPEMPPARRVAPRPDVVAGGDGVEPQLVGAIQEGPELDAFVAPDAGVRRSAHPVLVEEVGQHGGGERRGHVHDPELEPADVGHGGRVGFGLRPAAAVVDAVQVDQLHVRTEHLVTLLGEQTGRDRGVDAPGHRHQHGSLRSHLDSEANRLVSAIRPSARRA